MLVFRLLGPDFLLEADDVLGGCGVDLEEGFGGVFFAEDEAVEGDG